MSLGQLDKEQIQKAGMYTAKIHRASREMLDSLLDLSVAALQHEERSSRVEDLDDQYAEMMQAVWALQQRWTEWQAP